MSNFSPAGGGSIDPNSFTQDELLKHIYRQLQDIDAKMDQRDRNYMIDKARQDERISTNQIDIVKLKTIVEEKDKSFKIFLTIFSVGLSALTLILKYLA